jgi:hypothetical protein
MRFINIRYKCNCMNAPVELKIPERLSNDNVITWMNEQVLTAIRRDHTKNHPQCAADSAEYVSIPANGDYIGHAGD